MYFLDQLSIRISVLEDVIIGGLRLLLGEPTTSIDGCMIFSSSLLEKTT
jgi:hypothetical protein